MENTVVLEREVCRPELVVPLLPEGLEFGHLGRIPRNIFNLLGKVKRYAHINDKKNYDISVGEFNNALRGLSDTSLLHPALWFELDLTRNRYNHSFTSRATLAVAPNLSINPINDLRKGDILFENLMNPAYQEQAIMRYNQSRVEEPTI